MRLTRIFSFCLILPICLAAIAMEPPAQSHVVRMFGQSDRLDAGVPFGVGIDTEFTIEFWVRVGQSQNNEVFNFYDPSDGLTWLGGLNISDGQWLFHSPGGLNLQIGATQAETWSHVAIKSDGVLISAFVDGLKVNENSATGTFVIPSAFISVGGFDGALRQLRLWQISLSDEDILLNATQPPDPTDIGLIAWWPMDDASSGGFTEATVRDVGSNAFHLRNSDEALGIAPRIRWVRPEVLAEGPYFEAYPLPDVEDWATTRFIDFDNDGDLDVYAIQGLGAAQIEEPPFYEGDPPKPDHLFQHDGNGGFSDVSDTALIGPRIQGYLVHDFQLVDFTGDGITDIFVTDNGPEYGVPGEVGYAWPNSFRRGTEDDLLINESALRIEQLQDVDHRSDAGDIDGDGDIDVVSASFVSEPGYYLFYINNGSGEFSTEVDRVASEFEVWPNSIALIDADLDGDLDIFYGEGGHALMNGLVLNDGDGFFTPTPEWFLPFKRLGANVASVHTMDASDLNSDGIDDLVICEQGTTVPYLQLLLGNGDGTFRDASEAIPQNWASSIEPYGSAIFYIESFDQNGDGWTDLAIPGQSVGLPTILVNHGSFGFEEAGDILPVMERNGLLSSGDADGDHDIDLVGPLTYMKNVKPYASNPFPQANLIIDVSLSTELLEIIEISHDGGNSVTNLTLAAPIPHDLELDIFNPGAGECTLEGHVLLCAKDQLGPGTVWTVQIQLQGDGSAVSPSSYAVGSITADVLDPNLADNVDRINIDVALKGGEQVYEDGFEVR